MILPVLFLAAVLPRSEISWNPSLLARDGLAQGTRFVEGVLSLDSSVGTAARRGSFTSPPLATSFDAQYFGVLFEAYVPEGTSLKLEIRHQTAEGSWAPWRVMDHLDVLADHEETPPEKRKYLSQGPIIESRGIRAIQWRVLLNSLDGKAVPALKELRLLYADTRNRN